MAEKAKRTSAASEVRHLIQSNKKYSDPEKVVAWAEKHPDSALHAILDWDNDRAAHKYRVLQVQKIIRGITLVYPTGAGETVVIRGIPSVPSRRGKGGSYMTAENAYSDPVLLRELTREALKEVQFWSRRHAALTALQPIRDAIQEVMEQFEEEEEKEDA